MTILKRIDPAAATGRARSPLDAPTLQATQRMLDGIEQLGDVEVVRLAMQFGDCQGESVEPIERAALQHAADTLPQATRRLLERTAGRIRAFAQAQRASLSDVDVPIPGGRAGHTFTPVRTAGCYAPGGRYPLPSSVLMTVIPARVAGVRTVVLATPRPEPVMLAAAYIAGADVLLPIGGVQAIGALAFGRLGLPVCDCIVGPGNRWVTAAKHCVSARVGIDMLAGPSELVVLADASASPQLIAADLLAQAEHDDDARAILVATHAPLLEQVNAALADQLESLPSSDTARRALAESFACVVASDSHAVEICNALAPEHLEVHHTRAAELAPQLTECGALFLGQSAAEVLGDYGAGPNHTLPTGGTAKFRAGLSVMTFLRARTWLRIDDPAVATPLIQDAVSFARIERLEGHARSAGRRIGT